MVRGNATVNSVIDGMRKGRPTDHNVSKMGGMIMHPKSARTTLALLRFLTRKVKKCRSCETPWIASLTAFSAFLVSSNPSKRGRRAVAPCVA